MCVVESLCCQRQFFDFPDNICLRKMLHLNSLLSHTVIDRRRLELRPNST